MTASTFLRVFETNFTGQYPAVKRNIFILPKWFFRAGVGKTRSEKHSPKEFSARYLHSPSLRPVLSSDEDCGAAEDDYSAVSGVVAQACGRHAAYHYGRRAFDNSIRGAGAGSHVADTCGGQTTNEYRWAARWQYRAANMGHYTCNHRACMHISNSRCRRHLGFSNYSTLSFRTICIISKTYQIDKYLLLVIFAPFPVRRAHCLHRKCVHITYSRCQRQNYLLYDNPFN